ncbi:MULTISPECIES: DUF317 domain-containing protein [Streptomyces]|uniref:DUF317 domain-containing protein n=2 Tax=Streptomyces TaxID=1883 RepID=A0A100Y6H5_9ACTN|nr:MULTISPECIES: DUF317 domain-containing protein [Streptomyces]KUH38592.1 hypothetical protein ATE80_11985 [Streptomyces kanasensis]UUS33930.1 DUF317 domain-containing protein [Streptomyces changanensis]
MPYAPADAHVRFALHPDHHPAVVATTTGPTADAAHSHLHDLGFRSTGPATMLLARIDREEPYYTAKAAELLQQNGYTTEIDPALQKEIDTEWTWANYPMPWCTRDEIREVGAKAQRIHDDIAEGRLIIHLHADDDQNTVAVGSYITGVRRHVHLHGENHLRQISTSYADETEAIAEFHRLFSAAVRPGPAPLTDLGQSIRQLLGTNPTTLAEPPTAGPGDHEAFLEVFFDEERQWEKYRPFDETTIASHESLTVRVEFDHEARHRTDVAWTIAEYDGPVGERLWHATITVGTPVPLIRTMLQYLDAPPLVTAGDPNDVLHSAAWHPASHPARTTWTAPDRTIVFESTPHATPDRWMLYGGDNLDRAAWPICLSAGAPTDLLAQLASTAADLLPVPAPPARKPLPAPAPRLPAAAPAQRALSR